MNPWVVIDQATVPGDGGEMKLLQRTHEYTINVKNEELMNSRLHGSEDALAELTSAGDQYMLRATRCATEDAILIQAGRPNRWIF